MRKRGSGGSETPPNISATDALTTYERSQIRSIQTWKTQKPGVVSKTMGALTKPVVWLVDRVVPEAAIRGALEGANALAQWLSDAEDIRRQTGVGELRELRDEDLKVCDGFADSIHNWAIGLATAEGGVTGATGLPGIAVDIPFVVTFALRTIHKIGLSYGYECNSELDRNFVLGILSAAGANTQKEKLAALTMLRTIEVAVAKQTWKAIGQKAAGKRLSREGGIIAIKTIAKQLGVNLTKRKALQAIPVVGAGVGASVNGAYIRDVGWAARRAFQERWLIDNKKIIEI